MKTTESTDRWHEVDKAKLHVLKKQTVEIVEITKPLEVADETQIPKEIELAVKMQVLKVLV